MPSYTLIVLGRGRDVRAVREINADTNEAARHQALAIFAALQGALRFELWFQDQRIWSEHPEPPQ